MFPFPPATLPPLPPRPDFDKNTIIKQPDYTEPILFTTPPVSCWTAFTMESPEKAIDTLKQHFIKRDDLHINSTNFTHSIKTSAVSLNITIYRMDDGKCIVLARRTDGCPVAYNAIYNSIETDALKDGAEKTYVKAI